MVSINNKSCSRPVEMFVIERIEGKGYSIVDSKNLLTPEQKQLSLTSLSETGISRPEDSPFQCFLSYNNKLDKIVINYLEDGIDGNVKCRQFWFTPFTKPNPSYSFFKLVGFVFSLVVVFLLGFYYLKISNLFKDKDLPPNTVSALINCSDPQHSDIVEKSKKIKEKISNNETVITRMIVFLNQKSLGISSKGEPQKVGPCIFLQEDVGNFSGRTRESFKTNEAGGFLELLNHLKDF